MQRVLNQPADAGRIADPARLDGQTAQAVRRSTLFLSPISVSGLLYIFRPFFVYHVLAMPERQPYRAAETGNDSFNTIDTMLDSLH